jgi:FXSXX-COOH protein
VDRKRVRAGTVVAAAFIGAFTGAGVASASGETVESELADVSGVSLAEVRASDSAVLASSVERALAEAGEATFYTQFYVPSRTVTR